MDIFATICLGITAFTLIAISFWVAHIAVDVRKVRRAIEQTAQRARSGDVEASGGQWPSVDAA